MGAMDEEELVEELCSFRDPDTEDGSVVSVPVHIDGSACTRPAVCIMRTGKSINANGRRTAYVECLTEIKCSSDLFWKNPIRLQPKVGNGVCL